MSEGKRMGRPPKPLAEVKRQVVAFRTTEAMRDRLLAAAEASGRSMAQELEFRLEAMFAAEDTRAIIRDEIRAALAEDHEERCFGPRAAPLTGVYRY